MGERSDRIYTGTDKPNDWGRRFVGGKEYTAITGANPTPSERRVNIAKTQLPLFRENNGFIVRTYAGVLDAISKDENPQKRHQLLDLYTEAGLKLADIACQCDYGNFTNLQALRDALVEEHKQGCGAKKYSGKNLTVMLSQEQFAQLQQFYAPAPQATRAPGA